MNNTITPQMSELLLSLPAEWERKLRALADDDIEVFYDVLLKVQRYQRILATKNKKAWDALQEKDAVILRELHTMLDL